MRTFRLTAVSLFIAAVFAVSAFAQTAPAGKVGLVNTLAFDDAKGGITKYVSVLNSLETEFKPKNDELTALGTKYQALQKELQNYQSTLSK